MSDCIAPNDPDNTLPEFMRPSYEKQPISVGRKERRTKLRVEYLSGCRRDFESLSSLADALDITYDAVKMHLYKRRHGADPISCDENGNRFRIYED